ncbi:ABC1 family protein [Citrus sinensis]|uniref:ABC1 family protein n=1 Tax=Citrus sinensis TaxID=2711 RepID=A0ACB8NKR6_CITSI|nr:ABC1 family protein [Citrus sinensis]
MGWGNIYRRRMSVFSMAILIYLDYKAVQQREKWIKKSKISALWQRAHERNAKRVLNLIIKLEGLWVKLGQYLSTRADVLPEPYISLLKQLQDSLPPRPVQEVSQTIEREFGESMGGMFMDFVETPLATASIAQVHRATLVDGRQVVVKVQHQGIKTIILEDLKNAKSIVDWIAWAEPQYDFNPIIDEWCKEAPKELDFNSEAENTRIVSANLGCKNKHEDSNKKPAYEVDVLIPEVIQARYFTTSYIVLARLHSDVQGLISSETVLILEFMDGIRLNDCESLEAFGVNKQKVVEEITRAYAHQIYVDGFFNGDPHPGNFLVSKDPPHRPILLDFGLTKKLSSSMKQALAKMFFAAAEGDHVALLSAFAEMGLRLRLDVPEQAMEVSTLFFRTSAPANEAFETVKNLSEQRAKNLKVIQEKMKLNQKEVKRFNPVDAFPGDIVIFSRVLNLLRGLSSTMNVRIVYLDIMRPFAEYVLQVGINKEPSVSAEWIYSKPIHSDVEAKLRDFLVELGNDGKILGIQVCAYKDGEVIIDTSAGMLGRYDPRPVQPDSLFPVFSVTKGITAGMLHWLVDNGKLKLEENIANIWPEFKSNGKDLIKVHHVLNHTSGLHNVSVDLSSENPLLICDWDECLNRIALSAPETEPGQEQLYHYLSFGWLCGGIIERASGKKFQEILEEGIIQPLSIDGELYIGIPPGVESRLASLTIDTDDLNKVSGINNRPDLRLPSSFQPDKISQLAAITPAVFNMLNIRRAIIPAANGHCSARALARYYAALADGGVVPPPHSRLSKPPLGSHPHIPKFPSHETSKKQKGTKKELLAALKNKTNNSEHGHKYTKDLEGGSHIRTASGDTYARLINIETSSSNTSTTDSISNTDEPQSSNVRKIFNNPRIHDAFLGVGDYGDLALPNGRFGLGFKRYNTRDGSYIGFGHSGMGGSTGFCDVNNRFAIAVTLNKMSFGATTGRIIHFVCSELNLPVPEDYLRFAEVEHDTPQDLGQPLIN